jgi:hypothetical protein
VVWASPSGAAGVAGGVGGGAVMTVFCLGAVDVEVAVVPVLGAGGDVAVGGAEVVGELAWGAGALVADEDDPPPPQPVATPTTAATAPTAALDLRIITPGTLALIHGSVAGVCPVGRVE